MFSKEKAKGFVMGMVFVLCIMLVSTVFAENVREQIEVLYDDITIFVNGFEREPEQEPFIYEGTTFVPLGFVSDALGEDVSWDGKEKNIYIGSKPGKNVIAMEDMDTHTATDRYFEGFHSFTTNTGEKFSNGYYFEREYGLRFMNMEYEYLLDSEYAQFKVLIAPSEKWQDREKEDNIGSFQFYADGEKIYDTGPISSDLTEPKEVKLDLTGVLRLKIEGEGRQLGFIEPQFIKK
ncbi:stalk domain-containing protein [Natranaerobius thermophilus]|uniref:Copper amine oxidase-like N-terminal domain-containing protein n=1 Tax=Natranaerobius thermophilus (strain ATCC BAA-1301 / DSM 18059 / JW/NM-WN-LF) TaxID=457570 RepID=B2A2A3_NATTJ|nr:stalk domain-containing protein [Natranaerobius thermophilus]ACB86209.1 hypothetical protein Nther_2654 [Natranaerobius thermophilus JW/NM-WN-LF]